jgi:hypothetical protein
MYYLDNNNNKYKTYSYKSSRRTAVENESSQDPDLLVYKQQADFFPVSRPNVRRAPLDSFRQPLHLPPIIGPTALIYTLPLCSMRTGLPAGRGWEIGRTAQKKGT